MITQRIVYQLPERPVSVVIPAECGLSLAQIGRKDVPAGVPFWIVEATDLPQDRSLRNAWDLDVDAMGEPDGFGGEA